MLFGCSTVEKNIKKNVDGGNGFSYCIDYYLGQKIHVVLINLRKNDVVLVKSRLSLEKPSKIARRENAIAAINAGFFQKDGSPAGALKIDNAWLKKPQITRGVIGWNNMAEKQYYFDRLKRDHVGNIVSEFHNDNWWEKTSYVVGGAPLLIYNKKALKLHDEKILGSFLSKRYARSAICTDQSNNLMLIVVEGGDRLSSMLGFEKGLSIKEFTTYLQNKNCHYALNLDGGRSSTMIVNNQVVNVHPHFLGERKVPNVILVKSKLISK